MFVAPQLIVARISALGVTSLDPAVMQDCMWHVEREVELWSDPTTRPADLSDPAEAAQLSAWRVLAHLPGSALPPALTVDAVTAVAAGGPTMSAAAVRLLEAGQRVDRATLATIAGTPTSEPASALLSTPAGPPADSGGWRTFNDEEPATAPAPAVPPSPAPAERPDTDISETTGKLDVLDLSGLFDEPAVEPQLAQVELDTQTSVRPEPVTLDDRTWPLFDRWGGERLDVQRSHFERRDTTLARFCHVPGGDLPEAQAELAALLLLFAQPHVPAAARDRLAVLYGLAVHRWPLANGMYECVTASGAQLTVLDHLSVGGPLAREAFVSELTRRTYPTLSQVRFASLRDRLLRPINDLVEAAASFRLSAPTFEALTDRLLLTVADMVAQPGATEELGEFHTSLTALLNAAVDDLFPSDREPRAAVYDDYGYTSERPPAALREQLDTLLVGRARDGGLDEATAVDEVFCGHANFITALRGSDGHDRHEVPVQAAFYLMRDLQRAATLPAAPFNRTSLAIELLAREGHPRSHVFRACQNVSVEVAQWALSQELMWVVDAHLGAGSSVLLLHSTGRWTAFEAALQAKHSRAGLGEIVSMVKGAVDAATARTQDSAQLAADVDDAVQFYLDGPLAAPLPT